MIWLPYASYPASVVSLRTEDLVEVHEDLIQLAKVYNSKVKITTDFSFALKEWLALYWEHQDSFYTLGLYVCLQLRGRGLSTPRHQKTWARYWEQVRKFRRYISHPDWPEGFHASMREALLQRDWDHYSAVFKAEDEPFGEVLIQWP